MQTSARNLIPGTVKSVKIGLIVSEVVIEIAPGMEVACLISKESATALGLKDGSKASALVKATDVMLVTD